MYKTFVSILVISIFLLSAANLQAKQKVDSQKKQSNSENTVSEVVSNETPEDLPSIDRKYRYSKNFQSEFGILFGDYLGDETHNSWCFGGHYYFHIDNVFAVGASYLYTPMKTDWSSTFGRSVTNRNEHLMDAELMISNGGSFDFAGSVMEADLYLTLGIGSMWINGSFEPLGVIGGGMKVYTKWYWLIIRFDVNAYMHPIPNPTGDVFNADVMISGGISVLLPKREPRDMELKNRHN